jgi:hypothetical protein
LQENSTNITYLNQPEKVAYGTKPEEKVLQTTNTDETLEVWRNESY